MISVQELWNRIAYDPQTGELRWRANPPRGRAVGDVLKQTDNGNGYQYVSINRRAHAVHRVAWAITHGGWPAHEIDHINGNRADNRLTNLREATRAENCRNMPRRTDNTSGFKGVGWHKCKGRWRAYIQTGGKHISLGYHDSPEQAHAAYCAAALKLHGRFARFQ